MRNLLLAPLSILFLCYFFNFDFYISLSLSFFSFLAARFFINLNYFFSFREFFLFHYGLNYLFSPAISYQLNQELFVYGMRINSELYFSIILPAFVFLYFGLYFFRSNLFSISFSLTRFWALINESILKYWILFGFTLRFILPLFPTEFSFFLYVGSMIRFVAAFSLFSLDRIKYKWYLFLVIFFELYFAISNAMFHDLLMWVIFFIIFIAYAHKITFRTKTLFCFFMLFFLFFIQSIKVEYRSRTWIGGEESGMITFLNSGSKVFGQSSENSIFAEANFLNSLTRLNQAWIFSSVVDRMDRVRDFQDLRLIGIYLESAFLPRFLAPNKIKSGDKELFNQYSGHTIKEGTSMGLGVFSDGYIAFGTVGVWVFAFFFGLLFSIVFKIVESWSKISPFFVLFIFPILNYAVRPDCELQTILGHLVKATLVFGLIMLYYRRYFERELEISRPIQVK